MTNIKMISDNSVVCDNDQSELLLIKLIYDKYIEWNLGDASNEW